MEESLKILMLEDSSSDTRLITRALEKAGMAFTTQVVDTRSEFEDAVKNFIPDVVLSDHALPQFNSKEALSICRGAGLECPFILVTGTVSEEFAAQCIVDGADDYILKGNLSRLPSSIKNALSKHKAVTEREKAVKQLFRTNDELHTFIYKATHDLRGPLSSIIGLTNIINTLGKEEDRGPYIQMISESTRKLDAILISLIEVMSVRDNSMVLKNISIEPLAKNLWNTLPSKTRSHKDISFSVNNQLKRPFRADERLVTTVLKYLLENAMIYSQKRLRGSFVTLGIADTGTGILLSLADNGMGMDPKVQDKVFDMFYRGTLESKGSGLGLYIVRRAVERLGGTIRFESQLDVGTTMYVEIPG